MEFCKKYWAKITIAVLTFLAGLAYVIYLIATKGTVDLFRAQAVTVAAIVYLFGVTAYLSCKMLDQDWAKYILLGVGVVGTVFSALYMVHAFSGAGSFFDVLAGTHALTFLVVFGLIPLVKGIKKVIGPCCCTAEKSAIAAKPAAPKPAAAPAAPAAKPKPTAPKTSAKK